MKRYAVLCFAFAVFVAVYGKEISRQLVDDLQTTDESAFHDEEADLDLLLKEEGKKTMLDAPKKAKKKKRKPKDGHRSEYEKVLIIKSMKRQLYNIQEQLRDIQSKRSEDGLQMHDAAEKKGTSVTDADASGNIKKEIHDEQDILHKNAEGITQMSDAIAKEGKTVHGDMVEMVRDAEEKIHKIKGLLEDFHSKRSEEDGKKSMLDAAKKMKKKKMKKKIKPKHDLKDGDRVEMVRDAEEKIHKIKGLLEDFHSKRSEEDVVRRINIPKINVDHVKPEKQDAVVRRINIPKINVDHVKPEKQDAVHKEFKISAKEIHGLISKVKDMMHKNGPGGYDAKESFDVGERLGQIENTYKIAQDEYKHIEANQDAPADVDASMKDSVSDLNEQLKDMKDELNFYIEGGATMARDVDLAHHTLKDKPSHGADSRNNVRNDYIGNLPDDGDVDISATTKYEFEDAKKESEAYKRPGIIREAPKPVKLVKDFYVTKDASDKRAVLRREMSDIQEKVQLKYEPIM